MARAHDPTLHEQIVSLASAALRPRITRMKLTPEEGEAFYEQSVDRFREMPTEALTDALLKELTAQECAHA